MTEDWLARLATLWRAERAAVRERFVAAREEAPLAERVRRGLALADLVVIDEAAATRDRVRVQLRVPDAIDLDDIRLGPGDPVVVWTTRPDGPDAVRGVMGWRDGQAVWVTLDHWPDVEAAVVHLDAEAPEVTFDRGDAAIAAFAAARASSDLAYLRSVLGGERAPTIRPVPTWTPRDEGLDEVQRRAVGLTLAAADVALIHGPPGTGKTRTLVEAIVQRVAAGDRVLATAPSNTAVDNLGERLARIGVHVVRLGHPARVAPALTALTLDAQVDADDASALAREWRDRARALRKTAKRGGGREAWAEARALDRDAAGELLRAEERILARAEVVLATCAGADHPALGDEVFDAVVIDEATQAPDPLTLCALRRGKVAILAGDPCQLGPTVIDQRSAHDGLASTFFERLLPAQPHAGVLLTQQHRMHRSIMEFPSRSMYERRLVAAPAVAEHTLDELGVAGDPLRPLPLWLIDTAGKDWTEVRGFVRQVKPGVSVQQFAVGSTAPGLPAFALRDGKLSPGEDPSTMNPGHAKRVAAEVRRLLSRGIAPDQVAVIAAYHAQVRRLRELLAPERAAGLEIGTVDGFQGREKEAVIVDTVRSNERGDIGFLGETRRMNVALSRARRFLLVVADSATLGGHPYYSALVAYTDEIGAHGSAWSDDADPLEP